jgi:2-phosphoglycerate kinase
MKYILLPLGYKKSVSPMFIIGNLIGSGIKPEVAPSMAASIINDIPETGVSENDFLKMILKNLPEDAKKRFITLDMMKKFLVSPKSKTPLFMFLGGFTGKTFLTSYVQQHLGINRVIAMDDEKYSVREREPEAKHLWKATYEETDVFEKTVESLYPRIKERIETNLHDYESHKKWTFFWEGIYFTGELLLRLQKDYPQAEFFTVLLIPPFEHIKERYVIRWMNELGKKYVQNNQDKIEEYIHNVEHIKEIIMKNLTKAECVVISDPYFDTVLEEFYRSLNKKLYEIAEKNKILPWIDIVLNDPDKMKDYEEFLEN